MAGPATDEPLGANPNMEAAPAWWLELNEPGRTLGRALDNARDNAEANAVRARRAEDEAARARSWAAEARRDTKALEAALRQLGYSPPPAG